MYVVIAGAGEVGSYVGRILVEEGHEVALIERDEDVARRIDSTLEALVVTGPSTSPQTLEQAGVRDADLLLAVTGIDEVNLITCMTARKYGGSRLRVVARVRQSQGMAGLALSADDLGLDALVSPQQAVAQTALEDLRYRGSGEMHELADGRLVLIGMMLPEGSSWTTGTLAAVRNELPEQSLVVAVQNDQGFRIPVGTDRLRPGERAFIVTTPVHVDELAAHSMEAERPVRRVLVIGCGNTGLVLAERLHRQRWIATTIIERQERRAEEVANRLPRALVLQGDGSDPDLLQDQVASGRAEAVLVLLKDSEKALLAGIFAKSLGARKVIVRCDRPAYDHLAHQLGVDAVISPRRAMTNAILRYVRAGNVRATLALGEHDVELTDFRIPAEPRWEQLVTQPISELEFPAGLLIAGLVRKGEVIIPSGPTRLQPGDEVLVACRPDALGELERLLS